jgi:predicted O-methyltransferase YrrM
MTPKLVDQIACSIADKAGWCSLEKALKLADLVILLRATTVVELGVWMGASAIPMALALEHQRAGKLFAVDAWSVPASVAGQEEEVHRKWWGEKVGALGHQRAFELFLRRLQHHGIRPSRCRVLRQSTDQAEVPPQIDLLHHDANHGPQAVADIARWAPAVRRGGMLVIDDLDWAGGHVTAARDHAITLGFVELYSLGTGCVMQRKST